MQQLQICIGPIIRIGRESWCLPYAGFFFSIHECQYVYICRPVLVQVVTRRQSLLGPPVPVQPAANFLRDGGAGVRSSRTIQI